MDTVRVVGADPVRTKRMPGYLIGWRTLIAVPAWWGLLAALHGEITQLRYWSQVTTLTVALTATASVLTFAVDAPGWARVLAWCRGASTTYAIVTAVIYQLLLSGDLSATSSLLEHAIVPTLAVLDWVVFGPGLAGGDAGAAAVRPGRQHWWAPLTWLVLPICYLGVYYNVRDSSGKPLYPFLNPAASNFWQWVAIMIAVFLLVGFIVWAIGLLRSAGGRRAARGAAPISA